MPKFVIEFRAICREVRERRLEVEAENEEAALAIFHAIEEPEEAGSVVTEDFYDGIEVDNVCEVEAA